VTRKDAKAARATANRLAIRRGEVVQVRRRLLSLTWLWAGLLLVVGAVLVSPSRSARYPVLAPGEIAASDVVMDRDVVLPDPESTEEKRARASLEVLSVYALQEDRATAAAAKLEMIFQEGRRLPEGSTTELAQRLSATTGVRVEPKEAEVLRRASFSEELATTLRELLQRLYRQGVVADRAELLGNAERGFTLRNAHTGEERVERDVFSYIDGGRGLAETIEQRLAAEASVPRASRAPLAALLARVMEPNVIFDRGETLSRRLKAAGSVQESSIRLPRGRVLLRRGDEVTEQTSKLLAALAERTASTGRVLPVLGVMLILGLVGCLWYVFVSRDSRSTEETKARFGSAVLLTLTALALERAFAVLAGGVAAAILREPFGRVDIFLPVMPHATGPILAGLMFGLPFALLFAIVQGVLLLLSGSADVGLAVLALLGGVAAAFASQRLKDRYVLARVAAVVGLVNGVAVLGLVLWHGKITDWTVPLAQIAAGLIGALVASAFASFLLPVLESLTGTVTDIRLLELSNPNLPLLKRLSLEAPGTFQHSLAMANLAEVAAEAIGANPLLTRVCSYYHDIGKLSKPEYFVENQRGDNPHDHLTPWMSALVVSNHVKAGLELARQYRLPESVREAIGTHHGTKLIQFFYSRAKEREAEHGEVQESEFRYPGPRPTTKEMGVLMLADAVEAASRTLQDPTPGRVQSMIDQVTKSVLEDEQLDDCELTLKDIDKIGAEFFWVLTNAFHHRIDYPGFDFNRRRRA
jgi:cyclic-di-AMP phosphodiesterase PgpH